MIVFSCRTPHKYLNLAYILYEVCYLLFELEALAEIEKYDLVYLPIMVLRIQVDIGYESYAI